jgi:hypothetical protein
MSAYEKAQLPTIWGSRQHKHTPRIWSKRSEVFLVANINITVLWKGTSLVDGQNVQEQAAAWLSRLKKAMTDFVSILVPAQKLRSQTFSFVDLCCKN